MYTHVPAITQSLKLIRQEPTEEYNSQFQLFDATVTLKPQMRPRSRNIVGYESTTTTTSQDLTLMIFIVYNKCKVCAMFNTVHYNTHFIFSEKKEKEKEKKGEMKQKLQTMQPQKKTPHKEVNRTKKIFKTIKQELNKYTNTRSHKWQLNNVIKKN